MSYVFGARSTERLSTCHTLLQVLFGRIIARADLPADLTVLCGRRGQAEQEAAYQSGASRLHWPKSKHNKTPSEAVDVAPLVSGVVTWDLAVYKRVAPTVKDEWAKMRGEGLVPPGVTLEWGGDWADPVDGPHWQISGV